MLTRREMIAGVPGASLATPPASQRPNFIIFLTDDHGFADLGCQGAADLKTPHLDALAASGARFTNWYANAPVCAPSRGALLTGRYPQRNGVTANGNELAPGEHTIASLLKTAGYATAMTGKWHLGATPETCPNAHGFDYFFGFHSGCIDYYSHRFYWGEPRIVNYHDLWRNRTEVFEDGQYMTELITRDATQWLARQKDHPFFLYVPFNGVHYPMHAPGKYLERFPGARDAERHMYAAMLAAVDDSVGAILDTVRRIGQLDNTFVFYQADNGATREARAGLGGRPATAGSNGVLRGFKFSLFDGGMHVPSVMSWPGRIPAGQVIHEVAASMDVLPTICQAAKVALPQDRSYDGVDVLPLAAARAKSPHEALYWSSGTQLAVRRGKWKLVKDGLLADGTERGRNPLSGDDGIWLSDLETDPGERRNLRHAEPALADELVTLAQQWLEQVGRRH